jgi:hypothetical protein
MAKGITPITHTEKVAAGEVAPVTHFEKVIAEYGGGGGGFTPTQSQLDAMNSGITEERVEQIATNETNISNQQDTTAQGGNGYAIINGIRLYVSSTAPTGNIPDGSIGVGW